MKRTASKLFALILGIIAITLPFLRGDYPLQVGRNIMMYMALAISWDMLLRSGQVSFGIAGLFGLGAYVSILSVVHAGIPSLLSIIFAAVFSGLVAYFMGLLILRLRAMYFSIVTLALGEIFRIIIQNLHDFTGGPEGIVMQGVIFGGNAINSIGLPSLDSSWRSLVPIGLKRARFILRSRRSATMRSLRNLLESISSIGCF